MTLHAIFDADAQAELGARSAVHRDFSVTQALGLVVGMQFHAKYFEVVLTSLF